MTDNPDQSHAIWERQPGETDAAWFVFRLYRDLPYEKTQTRSKLATYKWWLELKGKVRQSPVDTAPNYWNLWESKHDWRKRVLAYDEEMDRLRLAERRRAIEEAEDRHAMMARKALAIALKKLLSIDADLLTPYQAARFLELGVRIERLALGETTENVGHHELPIRDVEIPIPEDWDEGEDDGDFDPD